MKSCLRRSMAVVASLFVLPSLASAVWVPLVTDSMFSGAQADVLLAVGSILTVWVILWAASVLMGKL